MNTNWKGASALNYARYKNAADVMKMASERRNNKADVTMAECDVHGRYKTRQIQT